MILLRSMWRSASKERAFLSKCSRNLSVTASSLGADAHGTNASSEGVADPVLAMVRSAPSAADVLATLQRHRPHLSERHLVQALRTLAALHRDTRSEDVARHPAFGDLCSQLQTRARALEAPQAVQALRALVALGVPADSAVVRTALQLLRCHLDRLTLGQIGTLDGLLESMEGSDPLVRALRAALPLAYRLRLPLEMDAEEPRALSAALRYCCRRRMPPAYVDRVADALLAHEDALCADGRLAHDALLALCQVNCAEEEHPQRARLLRACCDALARHPPRLGGLAGDGVLRVAAALERRIAAGHWEYYDERLMDAIGDYAVASGAAWPRALRLARVLTRVTHTHRALAERLCELAARARTLAEARPAELLGFVECLANVDYAPPPALWTELVRQMRSNPALEATRPEAGSDPPWSKLCLGLAALGHYDEALLARVFRPEAVRERLARLSEGAAARERWRLLVLQEAARLFHRCPQGVERWLVAGHEGPPCPPQRHPLAPQLVAELTVSLGGPQYVATDVELADGLVADAVVCVAQGRAVPLPRDELACPAAPTTLDRLRRTASAPLVCVLALPGWCFALNSGRLAAQGRLLRALVEARGASAFAPDAAAWARQPAHERGPYLLRELAHCCSASTHHRHATAGIPWTPTVHN